MKLRKSGLKNVALLIIMLIWLCVVPSWIVKYGMEYGVKAFDNGSPFYEVYSVFLVVWWGAHLLGIVAVGVLYSVIFIIFETDKAINSD